MSRDREMKKKGKGAVELWITNYDGVELRAAKWFDNRGVTLLSTLESILPSTEVDRYDRKEKAKVKVMCPSIVTT